MQINGTSLPPEAVLKADVAVVGAGPAGIVLALELAGAGHSVVLIESGGDSFDAQTQRLGDALGEDPAHIPMSAATRRQLGGASNIWGGRCVPFDPVDFEDRAVAAPASWPVDYEQLTSYFARACEWCVCGEAVFDAGASAKLAARSLIPGWPGGEIRATALERWSLPTNFGRRYRARLRAATSIELVTGLTCTEVVCHDDGSGVSHLLARTLAGKRARIEARRYVLACGGLEGTRLLFASDRRHRGGIGNHSGHLGRWYMAHVEARIARARFTTPAHETIYDYERDDDGTYVRRRFTFSPELQFEHGLPNCAIWLENPDVADPSHGSGVLSLVYLLLVSPLGRLLVSEGIRRHQIAAKEHVSNWSHAANVVRHLPGTVAFAASFGYRRFLRRGRKAPGFFVASATNAYPLLYHGEHLPNAGSYVEPTSERDALGVPRLRTHLHVADADLRSALAAHEHFDRYLRRHRLGQLEYIYEDAEAAIRERFFYGCHQAGTTRMSANPQDGVLDPDLAVHGFDDLFVASSSAFVTSSQANSTFTIVVFALRLAEHLDRELRRADASAPGAQPAAERAT